eukprot:TRINITY_DN23185_c0_g1_i1.p1 TRINITY_DN23185_c0_g1~~TRINITY_DN23185_c0_g1_i1.p1  ORF type:complete len:2115 (+),score=396.23 TRINITY_DN23185_c0_g1_i1:132-6476(+)
MQASFASFSVPQDFQAYFDSLRGDSSEPAFDPDESLPVTEPGTTPIRRLSVGVLKWLGRQGHLMKGWETAAHTVLDFSSEQLFDLATMEPLDFKWVKASSEKNSSLGLGKLLMSPKRGEPKEFEVIVGKLHTLKLEKNKITDSSLDPGRLNSLAGPAFAGLRVLKLSSNRLTVPLITMPRLKELDLSHNRLIRVPTLVGLASVEILNLSHNAIRELDPKTWQESPASGLRVLNLSDNNIDLKPTELLHVLEAMAKTSPGIQVLNLTSNVFCQYFTEYQMLVIRYFPNLTQLGQLHFGGVHCKIRKDLTGAAKTFFGVLLSKHMTGDGKVLDLVRATADLLDAHHPNEDNQLREINTILEAELGLRVNSVELAKPFFIFDRCGILDEEVRKRYIAVTAGTDDMSHQVRPAINTKKDDKKATKGRPVLLSGMVAELDAALAGHTIISNSTAIVFDQATQAASWTVDLHDQLWADMTQAQPGKTVKSDQAAIRAVKEDVSKNFAEQCCLVAERFPDHRPIVIRTLAKLAPIMAHDLGFHCFSSLAILSQASEESLQDVLTAVDELVLPFVKEGHVMQEATGAMMRGLCKLKCEGLEGVLAQLAPELSTFFKVATRADAAGAGKAKNFHQRFADSATLIQTTVLDPTAAKVVIGEDVLKTCSEFMTNDASYFDRVESAIYVSNARTVLTCLKHHPDQAARALTSHGVAMHTKLVYLVQDSCRDTTSLSLAQKCKLAVSFEVMAKLSLDPTAMQELGALVESKSFGTTNPYVQSILSIVCSELPSDPLVMAGALRCIASLLSYEKERDIFLPVVVDETYLLEKQNRIWGYLDGKYFKDVYTQCETHLTFQNTGEQPPATGAITTTFNFSDSEIPRLTNPYFHQLLAAAIDFLKVFSSYALNDPKDLCTRVSEHFNSLGRESLLFKMLKVPSYEVQAAVMRCLGDARLEELDDSELQQLFAMLDPSIVDAAEELLGAVLGVLKQFLEKDGAAADKFRKHNTNTAAKRAFDVLNANIARGTYGNPTEAKSKLKLNMQCCEVLFSISHQPILRRHLRGDVAKGFGQAMKDHETMDEWNSEDVYLEQTWTGRNLDLLLNCLNTSSPVCLKNTSKQAFRVFKRIADVLAGVEDDYSHEQISVEKRGAIEALMWNDSLMHKEANILDDHAYDDLYQQQLSFVAFNGLERMLHFLETSVERRGEEGKNEEGGKGEDTATVEKSPHSVAVELQQKARQWFQGVVADAKAGHEELERAHAEMKRRDAPEMGELEDTSVMHVGSKGEQLLRDMFLSDALLPDPQDADVAGEVDEFADRVLHETSSLSEIGQAVGAAGDGGNSVTTLMDSLFARGAVPVNVNSILSSSSMPALPRKLRKRAQFWAAGQEEGIVSTSFFLAALLRAFYVLLTLPTSEATHRMALFGLGSDTMMHLRLMVLFENCDSYVDCNVASKLMRIFSVILRLHPEQSELELKRNDWSQSVGLVIAAGFAGRSLALLGPLLGNLGSGGVVMNSQQLTLAVESVRLINTVTSAIMCVRISSNAEYQRAVLEDIILRLVPFPTIKTVFLVLLYDMQVNSGSVHGTTISKQLGKETLRWQSIHMLCEDTLAKILHLAPSVRYDFTELMYRYKLIMHKKVHDSFLSDLLDRQETLRLQYALEFLLEEKNGEDTEKVLQLEWALMPQESASWKFSVFGLTEKQGPRIIALTNKRLIVMGQSRHGVSIRPCGHCPPESFCPVGPTIEAEHPYTELSRIVCTGDSQMLVLGWVERNTMGRVSGEKFDTIIFMKSSARKEFKDRLSQLSGSTSEMRILPESDVVVGKTVKGKTASRIVMKTWAFRITEEGERLSHFVLTELNFFEFQVDFTKWIPGSVAHIESHISDDDYQGGDSDEEEKDLDDTRPVKGDSAQTKASDSFAHVISKAARERVGLMHAHYRRSIEEPWLRERYHERLMRRQELPQHQWLVEGQMEDLKPPEIVTCWSYLDAAAKKKIVEDRKKACEKNEQTTFNSSGGPADFEAANQVIKSRKKVILQTLAKCPLMTLEQVEFDHHQTPIMSLIFKEAGGPQTFNIRFMDDGAREKWRRGISFVLCKTSEGSTQWNRGYQNHQVAASHIHAAPRHAPSAKFFGDRK